MTFESSRPSPFRQCSSPQLTSAFMDAQYFSDRMTSCDELASGNSSMHFVRTSTSEACLPLASSSLYSEACSLPSSRSLDTASGPLLEEDIHLKALVNKLELLRVQRQLSALKCQNFLEELENYVSSSGASSPSRHRQSRRKSGEFVESEKRRPSRRSNRRHSANYGARGALSCTCDSPLITPLTTPFLTSKPVEIVRHRGVAHSMSSPFPLTQHAH
jgi:hypothetical protein